MRIPIRTAKSAILARRLGRLAVPLTVLPVILHHAGWLTSPGFECAALFAAGIGGLAVLSAIIALLRLWRSGDRGWGRALWGLGLGAACLVPFAYYGHLALTYPAVTDIATASRGDLPLVLEPDTIAMAPPKLLAPDRQAELFPNAGTRRYPLSAGQLFALVESMVEARGWSVRLRRPPAENASIGRLNARIVTWPGWREEAVFRVSSARGGARLDMRSASIGALHDFGSNGARIEHFMVALDAEVTTLLRDNPNLGQPPSADTMP